MNSNVHPRLRIVLSLVFISIFVYFIPLLLLCLAKKNVPLIDKFVPLNQYTQPPIPVASSWCFLRTSFYYKFAYQEYNLRI